MIERIIYTVSHTASLAGMRLEEGDVVVRCTVECALIVSLSGGMSPVCNGLSSVIISKPIIIRSLY